MVRHTERVVHGFVPCNHPTFSDVCCAAVVGCVQAAVLSEVSGDLLSSPSTASLCHCISTDIAMGKGIATSFKSKFGGVSELREQHKRVGEAGVLKRGERYVYYLISATLATSPPNRTAPRLAHP